MYPLSSLQPTLPATHGGVLPACFRTRSLSAPPDLSAAQNTNPLAADAMMKAAQRFVAGVGEIEGIEVVGQPEMTVVAFKASRRCAELACTACHLCVGCCAVQAARCARCTLLALLHA